MAGVSNLFKYAGYIILQFFIKGSINEKIIVHYDTILIIVFQLYLVISHGNISMKKIQIVQKKCN